MTEVTTVGKTIIKDGNDKWLVMRENVKELPEHYMIVGLFGGAYNQYGERIATYGYTQAGSRGSAPNWVFRARKATDESVKFRAHRIIGAAIHGSPPMEWVVDDIASHARDVFAKVVESEDLIDTGDLLRAITWKTWTHPGEPPTPPRKYRISRAGGTKDLSQDQQLYQLYHKGRSRTMTKMRKGMSYTDFKTKYRDSWLKSSGAQRAGVVRDIAAHRAQAAKAASSTVPGRFNQSQAKMLHSMIMGNTSRTNQDKGAARDQTKASDRVTRAAQRTAQKEQDRQYVASVRASLSGKRGRR